MKNTIDELNELVKNIDLKHSYLFIKEMHYKDNLAVLCGEDYGTAHR